MNKIKYPKLLKNFPDEIVEQAIEEAEKGTEFFKQFMLEECHKYATEILALYHKQAMVNQLKIAYNLSKLEFLEELKEEDEDNAESTETSE